MRVAKQVFGQPSTFDIACRRTILFFHHYLALKLRLLAR